MLGVAGLAGPLGRAALTVGLVGTVFGAMVLLFEKPTRTLLTLARSSTPWF